MITKLQIKNYVLFDDVEIDFKNGLTVLGGETGSGKSLIIEALKIFSNKQSLIKYHKYIDKTLIIIAEFDIKNNEIVKSYLNNYGIENDSDNIILKKTSSDKSRAKSYVNGEIINNNQLIEIFAELVEIHGQFDNSKLFEQKLHLEFIDSLITEKAFFGNLSSAYRDLQKNKLLFKSLKDKQEEIINRISYLSEITNDLDQIDPVNNSFDELMERKLQLKKARQLSEIITNINNSFSSKSIIQSSQLDIQKKIINNIDKDPELLNQVLNLIETQLEINDKIVNLVNINDFDSEEYEEIEAELSKFQYLSRKHNIPTANMKEIYIASKSELETLDKSLKNMDSLDEIIKTSRKNYLDYAEKLHEKRKKIIKKLEVEITENLKNLHMNKSNFKIEILKLDEKQWHEKSHYNYIFTIQTNPGQPFKEISKIASGGELSRFMLSLKLALKQENKILIFDEIDTGISGKAADSVGLMLKKLSEYNQILLITHQPQVAAKSDNHIKVIKEQFEKNTKANVKILELDEKITEIAAMISNQNVTNEAKLAAKKLIG